jgi:hypothetical protein
MRARAREVPQRVDRGLPAAPGSQTCAAPYRFRINRSNVCAAAPLHRACAGPERYPGVSSAWWSDYDATLTEGTGERVSISTSSDVIVGQEPAPPPGPDAAALAARPVSPLFRLRSAQPSRRAVVHLQATGDPVVPADLAAWFTERSCHFYLFGLRLPASVRPWRSASRAAERAFAELDAVCAHVREADGVEHVIVSAQGRAAAVAARWCDRRSGSESGRDSLSASRQPAADALILYQPVWPAGARVGLDISCPVLVMSGEASRSLRPLRRPGVAVHLGGHVTAVQLPEYAELARPAGLAGVAGGPASPAFFAELGRWLGAYMYGQRADQLL